MNERPAQQTLWILWIALLMSHFILAGVGFFLHSTRGSAASEAMPLVIPLLAIAAVNALGSLFVNLVLAGPDKFRAWTRGLKAKGESREKAHSSLIMRLQQRMILGSALAESVTILGFILFFLNQISPSLFLIFVAAGVALHCVGFPKLNMLQDSLRAEY